MRIGILQCDAVADELKPTFGDYPDMFRSLLTKPDRTTEFRAYDLRAEQHPGSLEECDAWLFTGSRASVYDDERWIAAAHELAGALHEARRPTIGICFGHQLLARALGGRVEKAAVGWGVGVHTIALLQQREWMQPWHPRLSLLVSHQDQVTELPPGAERLAGHEFCPNDMLQIGDYILTFQGHPEFPKEYSRTTMNRRRKRIGETAYAEGMASLETPVEEDVAAAWILHFLERALARQPGHA